MRTLRSAGLLIASVVSVVVLVTGCGGDDGADVREIDGDTSESGSGSGSGSGAGSGSGSETGAEED